MKDIELLASLSRELELDALEQGIARGVIPSIVDFNALNELVQARVIKGLEIQVPGGQAYQEAIRMAAMYLEAFVMGYRYGEEKNQFAPQFG